MTKSHSEITEEDWKSLERAASESWARQEMPEAPVEQQRLYRSAEAARRHLYPHAYGIFD